MIQPMYENDYLWSVDIRNQEPWILAHMTGAKKLIELAEKASDSGSSMYKAVYMDIFGHEIESEEAYDEMKRAWNMLTYGGTLQGLLPRCKVINAETVFNYFKNIKELSDYRGRTFGLAKKMVQSATTVFGTTVFTDAVGGHLQRSLMDIPIQGTGADILCLITQRIEAELSDMFGGESPIRIYFTRHDELIFDVDRGWQDENGSDTVKGLLKDVCSHRIDDWTAFGLDVEQLN